MFSSNHSTFENFRFEIGDLQDFLGLLDQRDVAGGTSRFGACGTD